MAEDVDARPPDAAAIAALQARGRFGIRLGLGRTKALLRELGSPETAVRGVLIGGTNGKGSTCALVERVLRIRELVYVEGLTLAGARRRLEEAAEDRTAPAADDFVVVDEQTRTRIRSVRDGLQGVLDLLSRPAGSTAFELVAAAAPVAEGRAARGARKAKRTA